MEKSIYLNNLFDYYGCLLTETQKSYFKDYYFDNLTQDEIAEYYKVTKNAVSKSLIETEKKLEYYESNLHLYENKLKIKEFLGTTADKIIDYI